MQDFWYIVGAYSIIWVLLGGYMLSLGTKISDLNKRIDAVEADKEG
ncbi:MAG: CcmD family protein [Geovibrio sp.]|nr:CcmD family protein [Geovibrio sp.]